MKEYQANQELVNIFLNHGFIDTSSKIDKAKGRPLFKLTKSSSKGIYFNYINIQIENSANLMDSCYTMTEDQLKYLLLYFKLKQSDRTKILRCDRFTFNDMKEGLNRLISEMNHQKKLNMNSRNVEKIEEILEIYNNIQL